MTAEQRKAVGYLRDLVDDQHAGVCAMVVLSDLADVLDLVNAQQNEINNLGDELYDAQNLLAWMKSAR